MLVLIPLSLGNCEMSFDFLSEALKSLLCFIVYKMCDKNIFVQRLLKY